LSADGHPKKKEPRGPRQPTVPQNPPTAAPPFQKSWPFFCPFFKRKNSCRQKLKDKKKKKKQLFKKNKKTKKNSYFFRKNTKTHRSPVTGFKKVLGEFFLFFVSL